VGVKVGPNHSCLKGLQDDAAFYRNSLPAYCYYKAALRLLIAVYCYTRSSVVGLCVCWSWCISLGAGDQPLNLGEIGDLRRGFFNNAQHKICVSTANCLQALAV